MTRRASQAGELEDDANRLRQRVGATIVQLRANLAPRNLVDEVARETGAADIAPADVVAYFVKRHPVPTALIGVGAGLLAFSLARSRARTGGGSALRNSAASLAEAATGVFRERAERKRAAFMAAAKSHIEKGATKMSDKVASGVEDLVGAIPASAEMRPAIDAAIQTLLFTALDALLPHPRRPTGS